MLLNNLLPVTAVLALFTIAHVQGTTATTTSTGFATTQGTTQGTTTVTTTYGKIESAHSMLENVFICEYR
jgi:hypothetical protein